LRNYLISTVTICSLDQSNSAKIYVVLIQFKKFKIQCLLQIFELDRKYLNLVVTNINLQVLDIVHLRKYSNAMATIIELDGYNN
jgi:hypothetical protein